MVTPGDFLKSSSASFPVAFIVPSTLRMVLSALTSTIGFFEVTVTPLSSAASLLRATAGALVAPVPENSKLEE